MKIVDDLDFKMEFTLYSVISILVDAFFDDEKEYRGLINMIEEKTSDEIKEMFPGENALLESLKYLNEDLAVANGKLAMADSKLAIANDKLSITNDKLEKANSTIEELKAEILMLKKQLNAK